MRYDDGTTQRTTRGKSTAKARRETIARRQARAYKRGAMTTTKASASGSSTRCSRPWVRSARQTSSFPNWLGWKANCVSSSAATVVALSTLPVRAA